MSYSLRKTDSEERYLVNIILWKYDINKIKDIAKESGAYSYLITSTSL
jgi:hypothetical protein